jgi:hypothetical protein
MTRILELPNANVDTPPVEGTDVLQLLRPSKGSQANRQIYMSDFIASLRDEAVMGNSASTVVSATATTVTFTESEVSGLQTMAVSPGTGEITFGAADAVVKYFVDINLLGASTGFGQNDGDFIAELFLDGVLNKRIASSFLANKAGQSVVQLSGLIGVIPASPGVVLTLRVRGVGISGTVNWTNSYIRVQR